MNELFAVPPELLMGEAGICGFWAMVAVAYVYQRNPAMNGWQDIVSDEALLAAGFWPFLPDPTDGARFVFSAEDLELEKTKQIVRETGPPKAVFPCVVGQLVFY